MRVIVVYGSFSVAFLADTSLNFCYFKKISFSWMSLLLNSSILEKVKRVQGRCFALMAQKRREINKDGKNI